jgi:hypothetical protein
MNTYTMYEFDLIICVYACDTVEKYKNQILKMNEVFEPVLCEYPSIKLLYFLGEEQTDLVGDKYINLKNVKNDYLSASYKQYLGLKYIYENYKTKFVMCIGTDTYVNIKKLDLFLKGFNYNDNLYIGGHGDIRNLGIRSVHFHSGGPGFIITKTCLEKIYPRLESFMEEWTNVCTTYRSDLLAACDVGIAYLVTLEDINAKTVHIEGCVFTHCNYNGYPCHPNQIKHNELISCHNMSLDDFDQFTRILQLNKYFL